MKIAAIDIGSNAIRFQVTNILQYNGHTDFKRLEYIRFPLRLGHDVFTVGKITEQNLRKFKKLMHTFKLLLELYEVDDYMACATSAMRESENGKDLANEIARDLGLEINIIDGNQEGSLINRAIFSFLDEKTYLHIDVGGGSTEINLIRKKEIILSESFQIGSVRRLEHHDSPAAWENMKNWVQENVYHKQEEIIAIGTGGNINKIFELASKKPGKTISLKKIKQIQEMIGKYNTRDRINVLKLNPDRADVIIPASDIYISVMKWSGCSTIMVPDVGLKDGILVSLFQKYVDQKQIDFYPARRAESD